MNEVFKRKEKKYLLTKQQFENLLKEISPNIKKNKFYKTDVWSIYYDTDKDQLIRRSIEKPFYKEKLRIRSYGDVENDKVFIELKKKFDGIVYKRRTTTSYVNALNNIATAKCDDKQIGEEIKYFIEYYKGLKPSFCIGTRRYSFESKENKQLRLTFDTNSVYRRKFFYLGPSEEDDKKLTDKVIMEIKSDSSLPLWLTNAMDKLKIYPSSFSKVGTAYIKELKLAKNMEA